MTALGHLSAVLKVHVSHPRFASWALNHYETPAISTTSASPGAAPWIPFAGQVVDLPSWIYCSWPQITQKWTSPWSKNQKRRNNQKKRKSQRNVGVWSSLFLSWCSLSHNLSMSAYPRCSPRNVTQATTITVLGAEVIESIISTLGGKAIHRRVAKIIITARLTHGLAQMTVAVPMAILVSSAIQARGSGSCESTDERS